MGFYVCLLFFGEISDTLTHMNPSEKRRGRNRKLLTTHRLKLKSQKYNVRFIMCLITPRCFFPLSLNQATFSIIFDWHAIIRGVPTMHASGSQQVLYCLRGRGYKKSSGMRGYCITPWWQECVEDVKQIIYRHPAMVTVCTVAVYRCL